MKKDAYYFSHDSNARNDEKIMFMRCKHGLEAYGIYWIIIEMMHDTADGKLSLKLKDAIAWGWNCDVKKFNEIFDDFIEIGLFSADGECYWSERVVRNLQQRNEKKLHKSLVRSEAGRKGAEVKWQRHGKQIANDGKAMANGWQNMAKGKESKVKESKENIDDNTDGKKQVFARPSKEDVINYLIDEKNKDEFTARGFADRFIDYYDSIGWKRGKSPVKDWKATVRTWLANDASQSPKNGLKIDPPKSLFQKHQEVNQILKAKFESEV